MKKYKQLLSEETEMERRSLESIAFKSWITPEGKAINLDNHDALHGDYHHLHKVVDSPELFGTTSDELQKLDPKTYPDLLYSSKLGYRKQNWSTPILRHLGRRGYIRTANHSFEMGREMVHDFELSNHGYQGKQHIQTFLPALKKVRDTIAETQISKNESISVRLYGMDGMKLRVHRRFDTLPQLDKFLTKLETTNTPRRPSDPLPVVPRHFNSTQTRQMLGRVPPPGMNIPQAIWNNMRTIGDSYVPLMTFKQFITESEEADPTGVVTHGNKIIIGVEHGVPFRTSDSKLKTKIQQYGTEHGFYYEGKPGADIKQSDLGLHDVSDYKGGFDEVRLQQQKKSQDIKPHNLSLIFSNVNANWDYGISDHFKSGTVFDGIHSWARSHFGDFVTPNHVSGLLKAASENTNHDFLTLAKKTPAESGKKFLGSIEKIAWPNDWATKKRTAGPEKLVDAETRERDEHLIDHMPAGVYIIGGGHLNSIDKMIQGRL